MDILRYIFDYNSFLPRGYCGKWAEPFLTIYLLGNLSIFLAYFAMPAILIFSLLKEKLDYNAITQKEMILARITYACFILFCGIGHLVDGVFTFQWPMYRFLSIYHAFTGLVSLFAVYVTMKLRLKIATGL